MPYCLTTARRYATYTARLQPCESPDSRLTTRETSASGEPAVGRVNDCKYDVISSPALTWANGLLHHTVKRLVWVPLISDQRRAKKSRTFA